jgi:TonB family protein
MPRFTAGFKEFDEPFVVTPGDAFPTAALLNQGDLRFDKHEVVLIPPEALAGHITGEVHLRLTVQPALGVVASVAVVSGNPVLVDAATKAARQWRFTPNSITADPIDIRLQFASPCPQ